MAKRPEIFPPDYRAILSAGEAGGVTGQVLKQIAELLARQLEIQGKITAALVYPIILVLMSLVSVAVINAYSFPISPIFIDAGLPLRHLHFDIRTSWLGVIVVLGLAQCPYLLWRKSRQNDELLLAIDTRRVSAGHRQTDQGTRGRRFCAGPRTLLGARPRGLSSSTGISMHLGMRLAGSRHSPASGRLTEQGHSAASPADCRCRSSRSARTDQLPT
jgi:general secretion pathway protein F